MTKRTIELGDYVLDNLSGLEGYAVARCTYLNGCDHIGIQPNARDGNLPALQWIDEPQVEKVPGGNPYKRRKAVKKKGGPRQHPKGKHP